MKKLARAFLVVAFIFAISSGAFVAGIVVSPAAQHVLHREQSLSPRVSPSASAEADTSVFWEAWNIVQHQYYGNPVGQQTLLRGAIEGLVNALDDPYSAYLTSDEVAGSQSELNGDLQSLGMAIEKRDGRLVVVAALAGSPAQRAGIQSGDLIARIGSRDTASLTLSDALSLLRGPAGSRVSLTIMRGDSAPLIVDVNRDSLTIPLVTGRMLSDDIAYLQIAAVVASAPRDVITVLQQLTDQEPRGLVLDLRNNPGGFLDAAVEIAGQFIADGTIVSQHTRDGVITWSYSDNGKVLIVAGPDGKQAIPVRNTAMATDIKLVVLVNRGTASAAEVLAAALQERGQAILVGERTFGKGSVSGDYVLSDGSSVHITNGQWLSPTGRNVSGQGLMPDIPIQDSPGDNDAILARGIEYLLTGH